MPPGVTGGTGVAVVPPTVMPVPVPPPPPPRMGPPPPDAPGDPMSCELSHMQLDPICTSCTCSETGCWGPVAQCGSDCLALVACVLRFCDGLVAQERTSCALAECAEYISAASTASLAGPCFERCRDECLPGLDAVIGYEPELDAGR